MNPAVQNLKDIHLPPAISAWQLAPVWITLIILFCICATCIAMHFHKMKLRRVALKTALRTLQNLRLSAEEHPLHVVNEISQLLRRVSLFYFNREKVAGLTGNAWLDFLNQTGHTLKFNDKEISTLLTQSQYQKSQDIDLHALFELTKHWLMTVSKTHREKV